MTDELGNKKLSVNDGIKGLFNGDFFKKQSILSDDDIKALQAYNAELDRVIGYEQQNGKVKAVNVSAQTAFNRTLLEASDAAVNLAKNAGTAGVNLEQIPKVSKAGEVALKGLSMAGNMVASMLIGMTIQWAVGAIDNWIHSEERAQEALEESVSKFEATTEEVNKLQEQLATCRDRLTELQKLADNGTISVAEEKELKTLTKQNDELERKLALKQAEQLQDQRDVLEKARKVADKKVAYQDDYLNPGDSFVYKDEEIISQYGYYKKYSNLLKKNPNNNLYKTGKKDAANKIKTYYDDIKPTIEAFDKIIELGGKLNDEEESRYESLKKAQDAYLEYTYDIEGTESAYKALNAEQQRSILLDRLKEKGLSDGNSKAVLDALSDDDLDNLWDKSFDFTPPQFKDYGSAKEYGTAYANAWLDGAKKKIQDDKSEDKPKSFSDAWSALDNPETNTLKNAKKDLTDLADAGKLTVDEFKRIPGVEDYFNEIGLSAEEAVKKINELTSSSIQLSNLKSAIGSIQGAYAEKSENRIVGSDTLAKMEDTFGSLGTSWDKYKQIASSAKTSTTDLKKAQDDLATAYINSNNFLSGLVDKTGKCTEANRQYYVSQLEELGIKNAEEVVNNAILQQKAALKIANIDFANATDEEMASLLQEIAGLSGADVAIREYIFYKALASQTALSTSSSVQNLITLANQCGITGNAVSNLQKILANLETIEMNNKVIADPYVPDSEKSKRQAENDKLEKKNNKLSKKITNPFNTNTNIDFTKNIPGSNKASSNSTKQEINWLDRKVTTLNNKISFLNAKKENLFTVKKKNNNINDQIKQTTKLINTYSKAYAKYMQKANSIKISDDKKTDTAFKKKIQNGKISGNYADLIKEYSGETAEKIQSYQNWYDKAMSAKQSKSETRTQKRQLKIERLQNYVDKHDALSNYNHLMADNTSRTAKKRNKYIEREKKNLKESYSYQIKIAKLNKNITEQKRLQEEYQQKLVELSKQEFDNIAKKYERKIQKLDYNISNYDNKIAEIEASGATVNRSYYDDKKNVIRQKLSQYKAEHAALKKKLPDIKKGTDEYYDCLDALQACDNGASDCIQTIYELNTAINDLQFNQFEKIADRISRITAEQDFLQNLFSHEKITDDETGNFTNAGLAKLGSLSTNYYTAKEKAANDSELLEELKNVKAKGKQANGTYKLGDWEFNSLEVLEAKIDETYDTWRDNLKETYEYESEIADMMKDKYQAELDLLQDLIDAKEEALQAEKDLHDYQRTITEKTKDISTIQKQIAAYSGDTSQEGLAKLQKLQKELAEKEEDLRETEYEKYISDQEDMLDKLYEEYEELVTKKLDDFYELVEKGLSTANNNTSIIASYLKSVAEENGYTIENDGVVKNGDIQKNVGNTVTNFENKENTSSSSTGTSSSGTAPSGYYSPIISDSNGIIYDRNKKKDMKEYAIRFIKKNATPAKKAYHQYADLNRAIYTNSKNVFGFGDKKKILKVEKMKELALDMGFIYDNSTKSGALYQKLLAVGIPGFKHGGIGELIKTQGEDGIAFVRNGEGFISPENVPAIKELVNNVPLINELMQSLIKSPNLSGITPFNNVGNNIEANYNFTLENCNNAEDIIYQIQTSAKIQKAIQSVSVDRIAGGGRLGVQSIK